MRSAKCGFSYRGLLNMELYTAPSHAVPARLYSLRSLRFARPGRAARSRAWSLLLALAMLALLPTGWDGALAGDPQEQAESGYDPGEDGGEAPHEQEALVEQRAASIVRAAALPPAARLFDQLAVPGRAVAPLRLARPYIPHPSRFSERRLI